MARRSTVDRSPQPVEYGVDYATGTGDLAQDGRRTRDRSAPAWRGAGGRWLVWLMRVVVWLVLLVIGYRGVTAIVLGETPASRPAVVRPAPASTFPADLAGAYALQFGQVYLNASPATAGQRAAQLAAFLPAGADPQLGWDGTGTLRLQSEQVAGVRVTDPNHAVVTLLARVNGQLMELGVPVYSSGAAMTVSGEPAWLAAPPRATMPASPPPASSDTATQAELMNQLPAFFQAYASGNQVTLARFLAPGTQVTGLGGQAAFGSLSGVTVPNGGTTRHVIATVIWRVPPQASAKLPAAASPPAAGLEMSYALTIVNRGGTWYISHIAASLQAAGPP
jgi:conjugative transposon protein TcpC